MKACIKRLTVTDSKLHFDIHRVTEFLSLYIIFHKIIWQAGIIYCNAPLIAL